MASPPIKCLGGKRTLTDRLISVVPTDLVWPVYEEVCLGGGALFFALEAQGVLQDKQVSLTDLSPDTIGLMRAIRDNPGGLLAEYRELTGLFGDLHAPIGDYDYAKAFFTLQRKAWNHKEVEADNQSGLTTTSLIHGYPGRTSARQLYLRYSTYNGLWRYSQAGVMNAPWHKETVVNIPRPAALAECCRALQRTRLQVGSVFDHRPAPHALVFVDPPYDNGFVNYTPEGFNRDDQVRLIKLCAQWSAKQTKDTKEAPSPGRDAFVIYTNADTPFIRETIAAYWPDSCIHESEVQRSVSCKGAGRKKAGELIVTSRRK